MKNTEFVKPIRKFSKYAKINMTKNKKKSNSFWRPVAFAGAQVGIGWKINLNCACNCENCCKAEDFL